MRFDAKAVAHIGYDFVHCESHVLLEAAVDEEGILLFVLQNVLLFDERKSVFVVFEPMAFARRLNDGSVEIMYAERPHGGGGRNGNQKEVRHPITTAGFSLFIISSLALFKSTTSMKKPSWL